MTNKPGWSDAQLQEMPVALRIEIKTQSTVCPVCHRWIDNRNYARHARACAKKGVVA